MLCLCKKFSEVEYSNPAYNKSNRFTKYLHLFIYSYMPGTRMHCMFALNVASAHLHFSNGPHLACQMCLSIWLTSG